MPLRGHIDLLAHDRIAGWAWDSDRPNEPVGLVISIDGRVVARCLADLFREDIRAADIGDGRAGFDFVLAQTLSPLEAHEIVVRREGDGQHISGSPGQMAPSTSLDTATRAGIETLVKSMAGADIFDALAYFAAQTEHLRDALAERQSGSWDNRHRRGLGWQEVGLMPGPKAEPVTIVPRALVIDDHIPTANHDAGSDAVLSHMRALQRLGYDVTFAPACLHGDAAALEAEGIATCLYPWYASIEDVLRRQSNTFKLVYLHRMANARNYVGLARQHQPAALLVYSVADLHFLRSARQAQIELRHELLLLSDRQRISELAAARQCDVVITHSSHEAQILLAHVPAEQVHVIPWTIPTRPTSVPFSDRRGVAFVAHYGHQPNADAARILLEGIMPKVWDRDPAFPCLLAGSALPDWLSALARPPVQALGALPDLSYLFDRVRLTVAPLAFGAGIKGKVLTSMAAGVPCVCTPIAAEGLDLAEPLNDLIADTADKLAAVILRLEQDEAYNARCAEAGLAYVASRLAEPTIDRLLKAALR